VPQVIRSTGELILNIRRLIRAYVRPVKPTADLAEIVEQLPASIAIFDADLRYLAVSRRFLSEMESIFSRRLPSPTQMVGRSVSEILPDLPLRWYEAQVHVLAGEELAQHEDFVTHEDGSTIYLRWSLKPWRTANGQIGGELLFTELITEEVAAKRALAESEARFRATFENAAVGIAHIAPDGKFLRFNKALSRLQGWPTDELITKSVQEITHPDDLAFELNEWERLRAGKIDSYSLEKRDLREDGTIIWIRLTRSCVRKSDGSIDYFVTVVEDISARKRAEEQVHLLMCEANHRVKNLLGLVQVIAHQSAASNPEDFVTGNPEDFIRRFTDRVQALEVNQDLLGRDQHEGADLQDLVRTHLAHFADLVGSRITALGPKLRLNVGAAQAIGLALHELATNAGKYGALSTDGGRIDVDWRSDADSFVMSWAERGGPPVRPPDHRGFGSMVIESMVKRAVGGEVELDYAPSGFGWRLTCPAANALEPGEREQNSRAKSN
jgi:PAS domain S-box-containing protein